MLRLVATIGKHVHFFWKMSYILKLVVTLFHMSPYYCFSCPALPCRACFFRGCALWAVRSYIWDKYLPRIVAAGGIMGINWGEEWDNTGETNQSYRVTWAFDWENEKDKLDQNRFKIQFQINFLLFLTDYTV